MQLRAATWSKLRHDRNTRMSPIGIKGARRAEYAGVLQRCAHIVALLLGPGLPVLQGTAGNCR